MGKSKKKKKKKKQKKDEAPEVVRLDKDFYRAELERLKLELVKWQYWVKEKGLRVLIIFEGRDAAGKGGTIKRMVAPLQPRGVRTVALSKPSDVERSQWYFQRYVEHLPSAGEIVVFDRSWYNRAGVERVHGFCTEQEYWEFLRSAPEFERMLVRSGIIVLKFWLAISEEEQERRFQARAKDKTKRWKLSDIDLEARDLWVEYTKARDIMLEYTNIPEAQWTIIGYDDKRRGRLNAIRHVLASIEYEDIIPEAIQLTPRLTRKEEYNPRPLEFDHVVDYYADK